MAERPRIYIGNYTRGDDAAIYHGTIDPDTGNLQIQGQAACEDAPSYLSVHPSGRFLYAVSETSDHDGAGAVQAFALDPDSGAPTLLNVQPTGGAAPCHNTVEATGRFVLSANYGGGSVSMHPIGDDGRLGEMSDFHQHEGSSVNPKRQEGPHGHSINVDPDNGFAFCCDLGLDKVIIYRLDLDAGKLVEHGAADVTPGAGPRHFAMRPDRRFAYVINEIASTVAVFAWDQAAGRLQAVQEITTLPAGFDGTSHTADIHVSPDGRWLFGSNRGHDSIAMFAIDGDSGRLQALGHQSVPSNPRNFALAPSGDWLYSAGQNDNAVHVFRVGDDGLTPTGCEVETPSPVCLKIVG